MARNKECAKKRRIGAKMKIKNAPRWVDIKRFGLKRARTRRTIVRGANRNWRRGPSLKV